MKTLIFKSTFFLSITLLLSSATVYAQEQNSTLPGDSTETIEESHEEEYEHDMDDKNLSKSMRKLGRKLEEKLGRLDEELERELEEHQVEETLEEAGHELERAISCAVNSLTDVLDENDDNYENKSTSYDAEKSKKISKSFKVKASHQLEIDNKFGKVHINTWDRNEVVVDIEIIARAGTDAKAQELLNTLDVAINDDNANSLLSLRTQFKDQDCKNCGPKGNKSFEINYTISMPKTNALRVKHQFGDVYVAELSGKTNLNVSYGSLKTEKLLGNENDIKVSFGSGNIPYVKAANLHVSYTSSRFILGNSEVLNLDSDFSKVSIENTKDLNIKVKYGEVEIGSANTIQGSAGYTEFTVERLNDKADMKIQYCGDFEIRNVAKNFNSIVVDGRFSEIDLNFDRNAGFNFDVDLQYSNLDTDDNITKFSLVEKSGSNKQYKGSFGKSGNGSIRIESQYGNVNFDIND